MEQEQNVQKKKKESGSGRLFRSGKKVVKALSFLAAQASGLRRALCRLVSEGEEKKAGRAAAALAVPAFVFCVVLFSAVICLAAFPLSVHPAGFALLSALGGMGKFRFRSLGERDAAALETAFLLSAFAGALLSCLFLERYGFFYLLSYLLLFLTRAFLTGGKLDDSILFRVTFSSGVSTGLGMLLAMMEGFSVNCVFGAVSGGILTPLLCYLICGFYIYTAVSPEESRAGGRKRVYLEAAVFTLFYLFLFSLRGVSFLGFSLSFVLAVTATLAVSRTGGALFGAATGMIGGMACAGAFVSPALAVGGFFAGLFFEYSCAVAVMVAFVSSCGYCLFTEGFSDFSFFTADYLAALLFFFPLLRLLPDRGDAPVKSAPREVLHRETMRRAREKIKSVSDAFSSLSEVFYTVGDHMKRPTLTESSRLVSDCCSQICSRCPLSGICWDREQSLTANETCTAAARLLAEGKVVPEDFSHPFSTQCNQLEKLVALINRRFGEMVGGDVRNHKTRLLAGEYSSVARLLKSTAGELDRELEYNPALETRAKKVLEELGITYRRVAVFGSREMKIDVYGVALERVSLSGEQVIAGFEKAFDCLFDGPDFLMFEESVVMRLRRKRKLLLECAKSGCTKKGEAVSGDSCLFFETDRDYFYTLICDGMGSGREAAFTSRLSAIFIEKLMHCATPKNVTLEMLNSFLMAKTDETFTTVDLLEVDLLTGQANFIKAGAAPSFVLRGNRLHRIESRTPPAGALTRMCAEQTSFRLAAGDFVILMSDGALEDGEGNGWLMNALSGESFPNSAALCERLFSIAGEKGNARDDLSISVLRIMNNR